jgi:ribonuclease HI
MWGVSIMAMRRTYQAVVIPQMLNGAGMWYQASMPAKERNQLVQQFASIQKRAAVLIRGAFRTAAAEALNIELYLTPMKHQIERMVREAATRVHTGPAHAIPRSAVTPRTREEIKQGGQTPIGAQVMKDRGLWSPPRTKTGLWETRQGYLQAPWQAGPDVVIKEREEKNNTHDAIQHSQALKIYTGSSGYQGHVRSAAELKGMLMALGMVKRVVQAGASRWKERAARGIHIFSDSQAEIKALINPWMVSGQVFLKACLELEGWCREAGFHVVFRWNPGHDGIDGNEKADELAKTAAVRGPIPEEAKRMVRLGAAAKRVVRERSKKEWVQAWKKEKTSRPTKRLIQAPGPQVLRYWKRLRKQPPQSPCSCAQGV